MPSRLLLLCIVLLLSTTSCHNVRRTQRIFLPTGEEVARVQTAERLSNRLYLPISPADNLSLYAFVADWLGTPYRYGSYSKRGTDCSGLVFHFCKEVYGRRVPRTSAQGLRDVVHPIKRSELREGDLLFFNIRSRTGGNASHVGIYLKDGLFVHASTTSGVIISSLSSPYYAQTYLSAGRLQK